MVNSCLALKYETKLEMASNAKSQTKDFCSKSPKGAEGCP
jgi:hypothetical protein